MSERRSVGPYRDARDALAAHREALVTELSEARAAALRVPALEAELRELDAVVGARARDRAPLGGLALRAALVVAAASGAVLMATAAVDAAHERAYTRAKELVEQVRAQVPVQRAAPVVEVYPVHTAPIVEATDGPITAADLDRHVRWIAPQAWEIDATFVERVIRESSALHGPHVVPFQRDRETMGVRVHGVRRDGIGGRLGLENGDVLFDVNGVSVADPDGVLALYARRQMLDALFVRLERDGEERVHTYRIVR